MPAMRPGQKKAAEHRDAEHQCLRGYQSRIIALARTLSGELIGRGIRVNAVSPGPIATPLYGKLGLSSAVVFLASDESAFTLGSELIVDGGLAL